METGGESGTGGLDTELNRERVSEEVDGFRDFVLRRDRSRVGDAMKDTAGGMAGTGIFAGTVGTGMVTACESWESVAVLAANGDGVIRAVTETFSLRVRGGVMCES